MDYTPERIVAEPLHYETAETALMTNMLVYLIGTLFVVAGLAYAAHQAESDDHERAGDDPDLADAEALGGIVKTRQKDPAQ